MMFMISVASIAQKSQLGKASYYADDFEGKLTASGEIFHQDSLFAAHQTLPFGTFVIVTNRANHKSVRVKINDRGPHVPGRIIDLSRAAMQKIEPGFVIRDRNEDIKHNKTGTYVGEA